MTCHYPDLGSASDWSCRLGNLIQPITQRALKDQEIALIRNESQATVSLLFETNWNALKYVESILQVRNLCTLLIKKKIDSVNCSFSF